MTTTTIKVNRTTIVISRVINETTIIHTIITNRLNENSTTSISRVISKTTICYNLRRNMHSTTITCFIIGKTTIYHITRIQHDSTAPFKSRVINKSTIYNINTTLIIEINRTTFFIYSIVNEITIYYINSISNTT